MGNGEERTANAPLDSDQNRDCQGAGLGEVYLVPNVLRVQRQSAGISKDACYSFSDSRRQPRLISNGLFAQLIGVSRPKIHLDDQG